MPGVPRSSIVACSAMLNMAHICALENRWAEAAVKYAACHHFVNCRIGGCAMIPNHMLSENGIHAQLHRLRSRALLGTSDVQGAIRAIARAIHQFPACLLLWCDMAMLLAKSCLHSECNVYSCPLQVDASPGNLIPVSGMSRARPMHIAQAIMAMVTRHNELELGDRINSFSVLCGPCPTEAHPS